MHDETKVTGIHRRAVLAAAGAGIMLSQAATAEIRPAPSGPLGPLSASWRHAEVLPLWQGAAPEQGFRAMPVPPGSPPGFLRNVAVPTLHLFRPRLGNGRAVLLIPGGAYTFVVGTHEGADTADALTRLGYTVFVLTYRLPGEGWTNRWNVPLQDAQRAIRLIRANAKRYAVDEARVAVLGYSAGGHLAASLATEFAEPVYSPRDAIDTHDPRPSAAGLIYPVITLSPRYSHAQSAAALLGPTPDDALIARRSADLHVTTATPPTFLAHALDDSAVPPENSFMMLSALRSAGVAAEAHFFERGGHGFGLGSPDAPTGHWPAMFDLWLGQHLGAK
ncbi:alpha/beta hydrolase [Sphingomonas oligophenolica]|uniref:Alpha/beta hydrolase n=1 Tax=Sphingomonas oligophenolica TaxID=301154 RepID=A0ABU9Y8A9_9SPHN